MAPEHVRHLSERETQQNWSQISQEGPMDVNQQQGQGVFRYEDLIQQMIPEGQGIRIDTHDGDIPLNPPVQGNASNASEGHNQMQNLNIHQRHHHPIKRQNRSHHKKKTPSIRQSQRILNLCVKTTG